MVGYLRGLANVDYDMERLGLDWSGEPLHLNQWWEWGLFCIGISRGRKGWGNSYILMVGSNMYNKPDIINLNIVS